MLTRKQFIGRLAMIGVGGAAIGLGSSSMAASAGPNGKADAAPSAWPIPNPAPLRAGDTIGLTSPSGFLLPEEMGPAIKILQDWGFKVKIGNAVGKRDGTFGGTDAERLADFQAMLDDESIKAVLCVRGGYGFVRIIDQLSLEKLRTNPKWLIGFSDITTLHSHIHAKLGMPTIHSKMCGGFPADVAKASAIEIESMQSIRKALTGQVIEYTVPWNEHNRDGSGSGVVVGGNLRTLETLAGTASQMNTDGKILFLEDVGEYTYSVDRMFWNMKRTGMLSKLAGLIIGGFDIKADDGNDLPFEMDIYKIVLEKVQEYRYPVCFEFPVGHQAFNMAIKCGVAHQLMVSAGVPLFRQV
ncbi:MAG: LD-carboxypeptidase [Burkholderiaceae bacterium]|nr:LD-carboxypeptidase [Burkholderiaceae bacterium]